MKTVARFTLPKPAFAAKTSCQRLGCWVIERAVKYLAVGSVALASMTMLTGCNDKDVDAIIDLATKGDDTELTHTYCESQTVPFAHTLCQVSQDNLSEAQSKLSLKLFWKPESVSDTSSSLQSNSVKDDYDTYGQPQSKPLYTFAALLDNLPDNHTLAFAANAGMYNQDFAPIGYTVIEGEEILSLNLNEGGGNFHLMPNGVLWWDKQGHVYVTESFKLKAMLDDGVAKPWYATQSGPMLVIDGKLHPKFNAASTSKKFRNGVGVCDDGKVKFVNSSVPVNFYEFASLFKDELSCPDALFLDGGIASALYAPDIGIKDSKNMGVMVGVVETDPKVKPIY